MPRHTLDEIIRQFADPVPEPNGSLDDIIRGFEEATDRTPQVRTPSEPLPLQQTGRQIVRDDLVDLIKGPEPGSALDFPGGDLLEFLGDAVQIPQLITDPFIEAFRSQLDQADTRLVAVKEAEQRGDATLPAITDRFGQDISGPLPVLSRNPEELLSDFRTRSPLDQIISSFAFDPLALPIAGGLTKLGRLSKAAPAAKVASPVGAANRPLAQLAQAERRVRGAASPIVDATRPSSQFRQNMIGLRDIEPGLTRGERLGNVARRTVNKLGGRLAPDEQFATAAFRERSRVKPVINSLSNRLRTKSEAAVRGAFSRDKQGRVASLDGVVPDLRGAPTIADIAARLPQYQSSLTSSQLRVMRQLETEVAPYRELLDQVGVEVGKRTDVIDGGFYLPRGRAGEEGLDQPIKILAGRGGRRGFEREAVFQSQSEGIESGFEYSSLGDALGAYARDAGQRATDAHLTNFFKTATDEAGQPVGRALAAGGELGRGESRIGLAGLEGRAFADELSNAANKVLVNEGALRGADKIPLEVIRAGNNLYRGFRSTLDNSALGIQGLLGMANDQRAYAKALKVNLRAWGDEQVLGKFLNHFDETTGQAGRLDSGGWGRARLQLGGAQTEFALGEGLTQRLGRVPGIRQANRAFGFFGDALRLEWADDLLKAEMRRGKSLDELIESREVDKIADIVNNMTGYSQKRFGGPVGDLVLFAPRFFQARLETLGKAALSLRPGATVDQRIARGSILKFVGFGTWFTMLANDVQGHETDFRPLVDGKYNPNFMRIRYAGRDWSLFGTWDSITRLMVTVGLGKPHDAVRGLASGLVANVWDFASGENLFGQRTRDTKEQTFKRLWENFIPFAATELPEAIGKFREGEIGEGVALVAGEATGAKSSRLSINDIANERHGRDFDQLSENLQDRLRDEVFGPQTRKDKESFQERVWDLFGNGTEAARRKFKAKMDQEFGVSGR